MTMNSQTLNVTINRPPREVDRFVRDARNFPRWATSFCRAIKKERDGWIVESPNGPVKLRFSGENALGVLDHWVEPAPGVEIYVPMRVVANGPGSEMIFTLFQSPGMSGEDFRRDLEWVKKDLNTLKSVLEEL